MIDEIKSNIHLITLLFGFVAGYFIGIQKSDNEWSKVVNSICKDESK